MMGHDWKVDCKAFAPPSGCEGNNNTCNYGSFCTKCRKSKPHIFTVATVIKGKLQARSLLCAAM